MKNLLGLDLIYCLDACKMLQRILLSRLLAARTLSRQRVGFGIVLHCDPVDLHWPSPSGSECSPSGLSACKEQRLPWRQQTHAENEYNSSLYSYIQRLNTKKSW